MAWSLQLVHDGHCQIATLILPGWSPFIRGIPCPGGSGPCARRAPAGWRVRERSIAGWISGRSRFQRFAGGQCAVFHSAGNWGVYQLHAWRHIQAACARSPPAGAERHGLDAPVMARLPLQKFVVQVGMRPAWVVGDAGHRVHPWTAWPPARASVAVCLHHGQALAQREVWPGQAVLSRGGRVAAVHSTMRCLQKPVAPISAILHGVFLQTMKMLQAYFDTALGGRGLKCFVFWKRCFKIKPEQAHRGRRMRLTISRMAVFASVVQHGSMTGAGRCCMSPSAVSQQVRQLEREGGVTLLHRLPANWP